MSDNKYRSQLMLCPEDHTFLVLYAVESIHMPPTTAYIGCSWSPGRNISTLRSISILVLVDMSTNIYTRADYTH